MEAKEQADAGSAWRATFEIKPANFPAWLPWETWRVFQAAFLLRGYEPCERWQDFKPHRRLDFSPGTSERAVYDAYELIKSAEKAGALEIMNADAIKGTVHTLRCHIRPDALMAWAYKRGPRLGFELPGELVRAYPQATTPAEKAAEAAIPAIAATLDRWQRAEPKLPFQTWKELAQTFAKVKDRAGAAIDWPHETDQATKLRGVSLKLADVEHARRGQAKAYNPEGVAVWLRYAKGANLRDIGAAVHALMFKLGDEWDAKIEAWRKIKSGDATLDDAEP